MAIQTYVRRALFVATMLYTGYASAVWNESISVQGVDPAQVAGATVTFTLMDGTEVEGRTERRDGGLVLLFDLPGDAPVPGSVSLLGKTIVVPRHNSTDRLVLNFAQEVVDVRRASPSSSNERSWQSDFRISYGVLFFDEFEGKIDDSRRELTALLTDSGFSDIGVGSNADDSTDAYTVEYKLTRMFGGGSGFYGSIRYSDGDELDGRVRGTATAPGASIVATSTAESDVDFYTATFGYHRICASNERISWFAGIGAIRAEQDDKFRSQISINGMLIESVNGSEDDSDTGVLFEAGADYALTEHVNAGVVVSGAPDVFGESLMSANFFLGLRF